MNGVSLNIIRLAHFAFWLCVALAVSIGLLQVVIAEERQLSPKAAVQTGSSQRTAIPDSVNFMMGTVSFTWTYRSNHTMPFTEHHSITSEDVTDALNRDGPVRIATEDSGELLIATAAESPDVILSARRYEHWTLISVLRNTDDATRSVGVFKFCISDTALVSCVETVLEHPDGTVTMTSGAQSDAARVVPKGLDELSITDELVALLTL